MSIKQKITEALMAGKASEVKALVEVAIQLGFNPKDIVNAAMLPGMQLIGERFKENRLCIPDVLMAARAMQAGLYVLEPLLKKASSPLGIRVVVGTVAGDLHDIGKRLIFLLLQGEGMEVIDLGIDVTPVAFANAVAKYQPDVLGMSSVLTMTMPMLRETIALLETRGLRREVKVIVGGSPVTREYAQRIGADGYAPDAFGAVDLIKSLAGRARL